MPGRTTQTGRIITKDLQAATAMATATQGAGLGHILGKVLGIAIGIALEIKIEMEAVAGSKIAIGTAPGGQTGASAKCPVTKEAMQARWAHPLLALAKHATQWVLKTVTIGRPSILILTLHTIPMYFSQRSSSLKRPSNQARGTK